MEEESCPLCFPGQPTLSVISKDVPTSIITLAFKRSSSNLLGILFPAAACWWCLPCQSQTALAAADGPGNALAVCRLLSLEIWPHGKNPSTKVSLHLSMPEQLCTARLSHLTPVPPQPLPSRVRRVFLMAGTHTGRRQLPRRFPCRSKQSKALSYNSLFLANSVWKHHWSSVYGCATGRGRGGLRLPLCLLCALRLSLHAWQGSASQQPWASVLNEVVLHRDKFPWFSLLRSDQSAQTKHLH